MRSKERIRPFLLKLEKILEIKNTTIGKLLVSLGGDPLVYYLEDEKIIDRLSDSINDFTTLDTLTNKNLLLVEEVWTQSPDLRFGQLVLNLISNNSVLEEIPDDDLCNLLNRYYKGEL